MALRDPVVVYTAADNAEADHVCQLLNMAGIEAYLMEDDPTTGATALGMLPQIHKPKVWVDQSDVERAQPVLLGFEEKRHERKAAAGGPVVVTCDHCGQPATFPAEQRGTVQNCPHCGGYLDIDEESPSSGWLRAAAERWRGGPAPEGGDEGIIRAEEKEGIARPDEEEEDEA
jgi:hypothetical protein